MRINRTLEDAEFKHIPVIAYDRLIMNTDAVDCYVSFDNYRVGALQAQFIVKGVVLLAAVIFDVITNHAAKND